jgi:hypothetical protein
MAHLEARLSQSQRSGTTAGMAKDLKQLSEQQTSTGVIGELWAFMAHNKKWWLTPILVMLLLLGVLIVLGGTGAAPFIYTLF